MKIICILTIPFNPSPPSLHVLRYMKKMTQGKGAKIAVYTMAPPAISWGEGGGKGVTCSDILAEHHAHMSFHMSYPTQTQPLSPCSKQNLHIEGLSLRLFKSRRRFKTQFQSVVHLCLFMKHILVSFLDLVPKLRPGARLLYEMGPRNI